MDRHLSPSETVRRFGVSIKALRLYEQRGLLTPLRSAAGWRVYGPAQIVRLHQILALKRLGLPLGRIGELLAGTDGLDRVLAFQEQVLARQSDQLSRAMALVRAARTKLASGQALSIDDLATLTQETVMSIKPDPEEMKAIFAPISARHFTPDEEHVLRQRKFDQPSISAAWEDLTQEASRLMALGDPTSPAAQDLARRWRALVEQFTGGDPKVTAKVRAVWNEALSDPQTAAKLSLKREIFAFMDKAIAHLQEQQA